MSVRSPVPRLVAPIALVLLLLSSCATYQRYEGGDASRLRISSSFMHMVPFVQRLDAGGKCVQRFSAAVLVPTPEPPRAGSSTAATAPGPSAQPRENMLGSQPNTQTNIAELKLPAGRVWLQASATPKFGKMCGFAIDVQLEPGGQHWIDLGRDDTTCITRVFKVEGAAGSERWAPVQVKRQTEECAK